MHFLLKAALAAVTLAALAGPAAAAPVKAGTLTITAPWARATPGGATVGAGYLTIANSGPAADRLVAASSPAAAMVQLHRSAESGGMSTMRPVAALDIAPGHSVTLAPNGYHLMMMGLKKPLVEGASVPATLTFEKAGPVTVDLAVGGIGAMTPPPAAGK